MTNKHGVSIVNSFIFISNHELKSFELFASELIQNNKVIKFDELVALNKSSEIRQIDFRFVNSNLYNFEENLANWVVFTDTYHGNWKLNENISLPLYSELNIFSASSINDGFILFEKNPNIKWAQGFSLFWLILLVIVYLII